MKYNPLKYYKKFKVQYKEFVVFVKYGEYYYTYDADKRIVTYLFKERKPQEFVRVKKVYFAKLLKFLHENNLNVVLVGSKQTKEYYTDKVSKYFDLRNKSRNYYLVNDS